MGPRGRPQRTGVRAERLDAAGARFVHRQPDRGRDDRRRHPPECSLRSIAVPGTRTSGRAHPIVGQARRSASFTIHGYDVYDIASPKPGWVFYDVPELAVEIATRGSLGLPILHTLAPSAREIALDPTYETVPANWRTFTKDGVSLRIPSSWPVLTPDALCGAPIGNSEVPAHQTQDPVRALSRSRYRQPPTRPTTPSRSI